jgi:hypothetical protein
VPTADVAGSSAVLTPCGWRAAGLLPGASTIVGVDRRGLLTEQLVHAAADGESARLVFVGTASTLGAFCPRTRLVVADGAAVTCEDLVENGDVQDKSFETHVDLPEWAPGNDAASALWSSLRTAAAASSDEAGIVLRRRDSEWDDGKRHGFPEERQYGNYRYCVVGRRALSGQFDRDWSATVLALGRRWLYFHGERRLECERGAYSFGLWLLSALRATGTGYRVRYDSLQHTAYMFIEEGADVNPVVRGACAFMTPSSAPTVRLSWEGGSWNPIVAGFLVAAGRRAERAP